MIYNTYMHFCICIHISWRWGSSWVILIMCLKRVKEEISVTQESSGRHVHGVRSEPAPKRRTFQKGRDCFNIVSSLDSEKNYLATLGLLPWVGRTKDIMSQWIWEKGFPSHQASRHQNPVKSNGPVQDKERPAPLTLWAQADEDIKTQRWSDAPGHPALLFIWK